MPATALSFQIIYLWDAVNKNKALSGPRRIMSFVQLAQCWSWTKSYALGYVPITYRACCTVNAGADTRLRYLGARSGRRSVRRLLPIRMRNLAYQEPYSVRPGALEPL